MSEYEFHPLANLFPLLEGEELQKLADDIKENGLRVPIQIYQGKILDGRNRYRACQLAGVEIEFEQYTGDKPMEQVISLNLHRRHLNESQRAMIAAELCKHAKGGRPRKEDEKPTVKAHEAAKMMGVGVNIVQAAKRILKSGDKERIIAIEKGKERIDNNDHKKNSTNTSSISYSESLASQPAISDDPQAEEEPEKVSTTLPPKQDYIGWCRSQNYDGGIVLAKQACSAIGCIRKDDPQFDESMKYIQEKLTYFIGQKKK